MGALRQGVALLYRLLGHREPIAQPGLQLASQKVTVKPYEAGKPTGGVLRRETMTHGVRNYAAGGLGVGVAKGINCPVGGILS